MHRGFCDTSQFLLYLTENLVKVMGQKWFNVMTAAVKQVPNEPIIMITYTEPWDPEQDTKKAGPLFAELEQRFEGPIFRITDFRPLNMSVADMAAALMVVTKRGVVGAVTDPRVRLLMVGKDVLVKTVRNSLAKGQYGELSVADELFSNTED